MMRAVALVAGLFVLSGCGGSPSPEGDLPDEISGSQVGVMAERQLESAHPDLAPGAITCPDLAFEVGNEVRCERVVALPGGRRVRMGGTVSVTSTAGGGRLHVQLDDDVVEYGVDGDHLAAELRSAAPARLGVRADRVLCPYLRGEVGHRVRCQVTIGGRRVAVPVVVTRCDDATRTTSYRFAWPRPDAVKRRLAFVATPTPTVVD